MTVYYNEFDKNAAQWLRNLIKAGHIAPGEVDERSIEDVHPSDLRGFTQCHFFAGIGIWSYALRRAGWPDDRPVWTGSCPCQPFSAAGQGAGFADERHLWPAFNHLIAERKPATVFGEQVASPDADPWIDLVHADLEALGYAFGAVPFPAAGVGAPNVRDRLYWVAHTSSSRGSTRVPATRHREARDAGIAVDSSHQRSWESAAPGGIPVGATNGFWRDADWISGRDRKWRPVETGTSPLVDGDTSRVGRLRGYGNAINAEAATEFIKVADEAMSE